MLMIFVIKELRPESSSKGLQGIYNRLLILLILYLKLYPPLV